MRVFEHFNESSKPCVICGTKEDKPVTLVAIDGTEDGNIVEAMQVHVHCLDLSYSEALFATKGIAVIHMGFIPLKGKTSEEVNENAS